VIFPRFYGHCFRVDHLHLDATVDLDRGRRKIGAHNCPRIDDRHGVHRVADSDSWPTGWLQLLLEDEWALIAQTRMAAATIIEAFDVLKDRGARVVARHP